MACCVLGIIPAIASAHNGSVTMKCSSVTYTYNDKSFGDGGTTAVQTIVETVTVDGAQVAQTTTTVNPLDGGTTVSTVPITLSSGSHTVVANAFDQTTGKEVLVNSLASGQTDVNGHFPVTETVSGCPAALTPGYWKNHQAATTALLPQPLGGYTVTTFSQAQDVFAAMNCGKSSAFGCLAGQLLAAELNVANQANEPACAATAISDANSLLSSGGYVGPSGTYSLSASVRAEAVSLASALSNYNQGSSTC
jgi:hypothetical protein